LIRTDYIRDWKTCGVPENLDTALHICDTISNNDLKIKSSLFMVNILTTKEKDQNIEISQNHKSGSDSCFVFPLLTDNQPCHTQTSFRDLQYQVDISDTITDMANKLENEKRDSGNEPIMVPYHNFPKWPYMKNRLNDVSNLLFWDSSIQVPHCFITEMLPWLSILLRNARLDVVNHQIGRTRRSKRYVWIF
jgi:hypothetical protein